MFAADPHFGGATWAVLQYILGLRRLGHDVYFVEPVMARSIQPVGAPLESSVNAAYFRSVVRSFHLEGRSSLLVKETGEAVGLSRNDLRAIAGRADMLFNVNGILDDPDLMEAFRVTVYLDIDAGFNQLWHATQGIDRRFAGHTHHVTIGQGIGEPWCPVPTCGFDWIKSLQPVVLERWPVATKIAHDALTTVGSWRAYGAFEHDGVFYGQKAHALRPLMTLPTKTAERFLLALDIHPDETKDLDALSRNRWELVDPADVASTPARYRRFIQGSKAEFGLVKHGYIAGPCGWFSDRSVCYLASGRPVLAQETGFSRYLPTGEGLFAIETEDDVLAAIDKMNRDYTRHSRAARRIAEEYFDSDRVLTRVLASIV
jgi:hypothetical protein